MNLSPKLLRARLATLSPTLNRTARSAIRGLVAKSGFEKAPTYCQRFARQVVQAEWGQKFDKYFKDTAAKTGFAFLTSPYAVNPNRGSVPGDLLYWLYNNNGQGHVVIRIPGNLVAENSTAHVYNGDARGLRTIQELGPPDLIVRLH